MKIDLDTLLRGQQAIDGKKREVEVLGSILARIPSQTLLDFTLETPVHESGVCWIARFGKGAHIACYYPGRFLFRRRLVYSSQRRNPWGRYGGPSGILAAHASLEFLGEQLVREFQRRAERIRVEPERIDRLLQTWATAAEEVQRSHAH